MSQYLCQNSAAAHTTAGSVQFFDPSKGVTTALGPTHSAETTAAPSGDAWNQSWNWGWGDSNGNAQQYESSSAQNAVGNGLNTQSHDAQVFDNRTEVQNTNQQIHQIDEQHWNQMSEEEQWKYYNYWQQQESQQQQQQQQHSQYQQYQSHHAPHLSGHPGISVDGAYDNHPPVRGDETDDGGTVGNFFGGGEVDGVMEDIPLDEEVESPRVETISRTGQSPFTQSPPTFDIFGNTNLYAHHSRTDSMEGSTVTGAVHNRQKSSEHTLPPPHSTHTTSSPGTLPRGDLSTQYPNDGSGVAYQHQHETVHGQMSASVTGTLSELPAQAVESRDVARASSRPPSVSSRGSSPSLAGPPSMTVKGTADNPYRRPSSRASLHKIHPTSPLTAVSETSSNSQPFSFFHPTEVHHKPEEPLSARQQNGSVDASQDIHQSVDTQQFPPTSTVYNAPRQQPVGLVPAALTADSGSKEPFDVQAQDNAQIALTATKSVRIDQSPNIWHHQNASSQPSSARSSPWPTHAPVQLQQPSSSSIPLRPPPLSELPRKPGRNSPSVGHIGLSPLGSPKSSANTGLDNRNFTTQLGSALAQTHSSNESTNQKSDNATHNLGVAFVSQNQVVQQTQNAPKVLPSDVVLSSSVAYAESEASKDQNEASKDQMEANDWPDFDAPEEVNDELSHGFEDRSQENPRTADNEDPTQFYEFTAHHPHQGTANQRDAGHKQQEHNRESLHATDRIDDQSTDIGQAMGDRIPHIAMPFDLAVTSHGGPAMPDLVSQTTLSGLDVQPQFEKSTPAQVTANLFANTDSKTLVSNPQGENPSSANVAAGLFAQSQTSVAQPLQHVVQQFDHGNEINNREPVSGVNQYTHPNAAYGQRFPTHPSLQTEMREDSYYGHHTDFHSGNVDTATTVYSSVPRSDSQTQSRPDLPGHTEQRAHHDRTTYPDRGEPSTEMFPRPGSLEMAHKDHHMHIYTSPIQPSPNSPFQPPRTRRESSSSDHQDWNSNQEWRGQPNTSGRPRQISGSSTGSRTTPVDAYKHMTTLPQTQPETVLQSSVRGSEPITSFHHDQYQMWSSESVQSDSAQHGQNFAYQNVRHEDKSVEPINQTMDERRSVFAPEAVSNHFQSQETSAPVVPSHGRPVVDQEPVDNMNDIRVPPSVAPPSVVPSTISVSHVTSEGSGAGQIVSHSVASTSSYTHPNQTNAASNQPLDCHGPSYNIPSSIPPALPSNTAFSSRGTTDSVMNVSSDRAFGSQTNPQTQANTTFPAAGQVLAASTNNATGISQTPAHQLAPQQTPAHQLAPQQTPAHQLAPQQMPAHQLAPQQIPAHQLAPQQMPTHQLAPQQTPAHQLAPQQTPAHQLAPQQMPTHQLAPQQTPAHQLAPQQTPAHQLAPQQTPAHQLAPQQTPAHQLAPQQTPAHQLAPQQTPAYLLAPQQTSAYLLAPQQTSAYLLAPQQTPAHQLAPQQTSAYLLDPQQTSAHQLAPQQTPTDPITNNQTQTNQMPSYLPGASFPSSGLDTTNERRIVNQIDHSYSANPTTPSHASINDSYSLGSEMSSSQQSLNQMIPDQSYERLPTDNHSLQGQTFNVGVNEPSAVSSDTSDATSRSRAQDSEFKVPAAPLTSGELRVSQDYVPLPDKSHARQRDPRYERPVTPARDDTDQRRHGDRRYDDRRGGDDDDRRYDDNDRRYDYDRNRQDPRYYGYDYVDRRYNDRPSSRSSLQGDDYHRHDSYYRSRSGQGSEPDVSYRPPSRPSSRQGEAERPTSRPSSRQGVPDRTQSQPERYRGPTAEYGGRGHDYGGDEGRHVRSARPSARQEEHEPRTRSAQRYDRADNYGNYNYSDRDYDRGRSTTSRHYDYDRYYGTYDAAAYDEYYRRVASSYNRGYYDELQYYGQQQPQYGNGYYFDYHTGRWRQYEYGDRQPSRGATPNLEDYDRSSRSDSRPTSRQSDNYEYENQTRLDTSADYTDSPSLLADQTIPGLDDSIAVTKPRLTPVKFALPHVCARFSSFGHLIKVLPNRPTDGQAAVVEVHDLDAMISPEFSDVDIHRTFPGPLVRGETHKNDVLSYCHTMARHCRENVLVVDRESAELIWRLLELFIKQNGTIVGTDISDLLLENHEPKTEDYRRSGISVERGGDGVVTADRTNVSRQVAHPSMEEITDRFRHLLLYGRKKDALEWATKHELWGHALFLASKMDARTHASIMTRFANNAMKMNDPLQTLYQLMSGRQPAAVTCIADDRWGDWRPHLAMVLSSRVGALGDGGAGATPAPPGLAAEAARTELERRSLTTLGDTLATRGCLHASHFCYVMAQTPFGRYHTKTCKLVLIGSSHSLPFAQFASTEAIQCTEVYEYAQSLGNPNHVMYNFQVYKFIYAIQLYNSGLVLEAYRYCEVIGKTITLNPAAYNPTLVRQVAEFAGRLKSCDPQYQHGGHFHDPYWLVQLHHIIQAYKDGTIVPSSEAASSLYGSTSASESGEYPGQALVAAYTTSQISGDANGQSYNYNQGEVQQLQPDETHREDIEPYLWDGQAWQINPEYAAKYGLVNTNDASQEQEVATVSEPHSPHATNQHYFQHEAPTNHEPSNGHDSSGYDYEAEAQDGVDDLVTASHQTFDFYAGANASQPARRLSSASSIYEPGTSPGTYETPPSRRESVVSTTARSRVSSESLSESASPRSTHGYQNKEGSSGPSSPITRHAPPLPSPGAVAPPPPPSSGADNASPKHQQQQGQQGQQGQRGPGIFRGILNRFKPKNQVNLPDDKDPTIVWDPVKKKWINKDGDEEEDGAAAPPPKDSELIARSPGADAASGPYGGMVSPTQLSAPPSWNRLSSLKAKGARGQYVDVLNQSNAGSPPKNVAVPPSLFNVLPSAGAPPGGAMLYVPSQSDRSAGDEQRQIGNPDSPPTTPDDPADDVDLSRSSSESSLGREVQTLTSQPTTQRAAVGSGASHQVAPGGHGNQVVPPVNTGNQAPPIAAIQQEPTPGGMMMFNPSQFSHGQSQNFAPSAAATATTSSSARLKYGQRRAYPK